jgi:hypothetical protein
MNKKIQIGIEEFEKLTPVFEEIEKNKGIILFVFTFYLKLT